MKIGVIKQAWNRVFKFVKKHYPNNDYKNNRNLNLEFYCLILNIPKPFINKDKDKFVVNECNRINSPIYKNIVLPVKHRKKVKGEKRLKRKAYNDYLNSEAWKSLKRLLIQERGTKCQKCGKDGLRLDGHHLTYKRLFNEMPEDILLICRKCHEKIHNKKIGN